MNAIVINTIAIIFTSNIVKTMSAQGVFNVGADLLNSTYLALVLAIPFTLFIFSFPSYIFLTAFNRHNSSKDEKDKLLLSKAIILELISLSLINNGQKLLTSLESKVLIISYGFFIVSVYLYITNINYVISIANT